jgi:hypothetical protein
VNTTAWWYLDAAARATRNDHRLHPPVAWRDGRPGHTTTHSMPHVPFALNEVEMRCVLLLLLGIPIPIIMLIALFVH